MPEAPSLKDAATRVALEWFLGPSASPSLAAAHYQPLPTLQRRVEQLSSQQALVGTLATLAAAEIAKGADASAEEQAALRPWLLHHVTSSLQPTLDELRGAQAQGTFVASSTAGAALLAATVDRLAQLAVENERQRCLRYRLGLR